MNSAVPLQDHNHDHVGFISGMQGWHNIHKSINIIDTTHTQNEDSKSHDHINVILI